MTGKCYFIDSGDEPKVVQAPDKVETYAIGPCTGVGILDQRKKRGYLGHYFFNTNSSENLVDMAIREATNRGDLEVALVGNIPWSFYFAEESKEEYKETLETFKRHKAWILQMVRLKGIKRVQNYLEENPKEYLYGMIVDPEKRKIEVLKELFEIK